MNDDGVADEDDHEDEFPPSNSRRTSNASVLSESASPITVPDLKTSLRRSSITSSPRRRVFSPSVRTANPGSSAPASPRASNASANSNVSATSLPTPRASSASAGSVASAASSPHSASTARTSRTREITTEPLRTRRSRGYYQTDLSNFSSGNPEPQMTRRYSDSYLDFRPAAARAGLYPQHRIPRPLQIQGESAFEHVKAYIKYKLIHFWHGQSRYAKIHFVSYFVIGFVTGFVIWAVEHKNIGFLDSLFLAVSMLTGTGLLTTDFTKLHLFTQILSLLLLFGGSPLTVVLPITLVVRRHCSGPRQKQALMRLFNISLFYYVSFILVPFFVYGFYLNDPSRKPILDGVNPFWFAIFHSISAFTNGGVALFSDSMIRFATDYVIVLFTSAQIIFGYMAIPLALRFLIWVSTFLPFISKKPSLLLLKTPAFAGYLFPRLETQIITLVIVGIIIVGTLSNVAFEYHRSLEQFSPRHKFLVAFFNDITTRNAGLNSIDFSQNYDVTNLIAIYWMYISGYPVGVRVSRNMQPHVLGEAMGFYAKKFLMSGKWWIAFFLLVITFAERHSLAHDPNFTFFKVLFEVISAYGTVGLTLGYPNIAFSFCGVWHAVSKISLIIIMFIGRHRRLKGTLLNSVYEANMIGNPFADVERPAPSE
eukprot:Phypoly_transcript_04193.p1 GENE.Phypoly_transcript_04193~~Phypoly_transcript_04193.p1  ORF type:complete len:652 (+),score=49.44 Phypoly_transcript_04193:26-1981(+)